MYTLHIGKRSNIMCEFITAFTCGRDDDLASIKVHLSLNIFFVHDHNNYYDLCKSVKDILNRYNYKHEAVYLPDSASTYNNIIIP